MKKYTCSDYRQEMILNALRKRLANEQMSAEEQARIEHQIKELEKDMGMD